ncbi:ABC transporter permease [Candidatus Bipolaricaulota bacterium]|nr:ABC transporter permease [Candidatus Bipolaricaulota bacterium]
MPARLKYLVFRTFQALITLGIVILILSSLFNSMSEEQMQTRIRQSVTAQVRNSPELQQLSDEELKEWRENEIAKLRERRGLNEPLWKRIFTDAWDRMTLNFGQSFMMTAPGGSRQVMDIVMSRLPRTILLFTTAAVIYVILGLVVGLKAAQVAGGKLDRFLSIFGMTSSSMPMWWLGMLAILIFAYQLGWFPSTAMPLPQTTGLDYYIGVLYRLALPLATIVFNIFGARAWVTRNIVTDVLQDDYIMAARAKGVPERKVIYGHTLRTAAPPVITSALLSLLMSIGGAMITEVIFNWPGIGLLTRIAIMQGDIPVVMGVMFITSALYIFGYLVADLLYGLLDPRVEVGSSQAMR